MRFNLNWVLVVSLITVTLFHCTPQKEKETSYDLVIAGGRIMDPESGLDAIRNVGIIGDSIAAITQETLIGARVIDATGLVVSPGFIDLHAHGQTEDSYRLMVADGVTSAFELEVGTAEVVAWYQERESGQLINYGASIGHISVRMAIMGDSADFLPSGPGGKKVATEAEIEEMQARITQGLKQGALGVGFGLAYTPATTEAEFETMMTTVAAHDATAFIHLAAGLKGVKQSIQMAAKTNASLHIVHINSSGSDSTAQYLEEIQRARDAGQDVTTEAYPYEAGMTSIQAAFFDDWRSWEDEEYAKFQWVKTGERLNRESFGKYRKQGGAIILHNRTEAMTNTAIESPLTMIASDGFMIDGLGHPRTSGTFSKVLGKYVRERESFSLMEGLAKMTIQPAQRLETYVPPMLKKGRIKLGADADITIFDPETILDRSTYMEATLPSEGIYYVLVNGVVVIDDGKLQSNVRPGTGVRNQ